MARKRDRGPASGKWAAGGSQNRRLLARGGVGAAAPCGASVVVDIDVPLRWGTASAADGSPGQIAGGDVAEATSRGTVSTRCRQSQRCVEQPLRRVTGPGGPAPAAVAPPR